MVDQKGIAIVPARGGSKRLKDKNIQKLNDKPLIYHTLETLSGCFESDNIIVASDSDKILTLADDHFSRPQTIQLPASTTTDQSTVLDSICWLLDYGTFDSADWIGMFLPTCPLRSKADVFGGMGAFTDDVDGIISTTDYEFPPTLGLVKDQDGLLHCVDPSLPWLTGNTRSQDHTSVIRPNGALYLKRLQAFRRDRNFYKGRIKSYHMPRSRSADIDSLEDLIALEKRG